MVILFLPEEAPSFPPGELAPPSVNSVRTLRPRFNRFHWQRLTNEARLSSTMPSSSCPVFSVEPSLKMLALMLVHLLPSENQLQGGPNSKLPEACGGRHSWMKDQISDQIALKISLPWFMSTEKEKIWFSPKIFQNTKSSLFQETAKHDEAESIWSQQFQLSVRSNFIWSVHLAPWRISGR